MGEYYKEQPFKIHVKIKKDNYAEISGVIDENNEHVKREKPTKAQTRIKKSENNN